MAIIIDPVTGQRKFVQDNSGGFRAPTVPVEFRKPVGPTAAELFRKGLQTPVDVQPNEFARGLRSGIEQVRGLGNSALAAGAGLVGADEFSAEQTRQANRDFARAGRIGPRVKDFDTATESFENFTDFLAGGLGQAVPTFATAAAGGIGGVLAKNLLKSGVSNTVAGAGGAFAATEGLETGGIFNEIINDPEARKNRTLSELAGISFTGALPAAALDTLPLVVAARKFGLGLSARKEITSKMREFGKGVTSQALLEGSTEAAQTVIERATHKFVNDNVDILGPEGMNEVLGALTIGTAFGGIVGGGVTLPGIIGSRMAELDQESQDKADQAEATFNKLRKVDDDQLQGHLDLIQENFELSDPEIQEDLESALKDFNLRKPKFARSVTDNSEVQAFGEEVIRLRKIRDNRFLTPNGQSLVNTPEAIAFQEFLDGKTREYLTLKQRVADARVGKTESNQFQRRARASKNILEEERPFDFDVPLVRRKTKPPIVDRTDDITAGLDTVERGLARRRVSTRKELKLEKEKVFNEKGGIVRVQTEAPTSRKSVSKIQDLSDEEINRLGSVSSGEVFTTDQNSIIGDPKANVAFTDRIDKTGEVALSDEVDPETGEKLPMTASFFAKRDIAKLEKDNPNASFREVPAFKAFQERARSLANTNELGTTQNEEIIRLVQDDNLRMRTLSVNKQVDPTSIDTIKKVKRHLEGRVFIERTNKPPALRPALPEQLTADQIENRQTPVEKEDRQRAFANISTEIANLKELDPSQDSFQKQLISINKLRDKVESGINPLQNAEVLDLMESRGVELTGDTTLDISNAKSAVADEQFQLQEIFDGTELAVLVKRQEDLKKVLDKRKLNKVIRKKSVFSEEAKAFFEETTEPPSVTGPINIYWGTKDNKQFSNLADRSFTYEGRKYRSVEQAYQSLKSGQFDQATFDKFKKEGQLVRGKLEPMAPHKRIKLIRELMYQSFRQNQKSMKALLATRNRRFTHNEANAFWQKEFPAALRDVRNRLRQDEFSQLRQNDPASRFLLFGKNEAGETIAVRPHSMVQKNFQRIFGGQGKKYTKETVGVAFTAGLADLLVNEGILITPNAFTDDVIVFTDASKHPFTIGEIKALSRGQALKAAKSGAEVLLGRLKTDQGKKFKPDSIDAVAARIAELTRSIETAKRAELYAVSVTDELAENTAKLEDLAQLRSDASVKVSNLQDALLEELEGNELFSGFNLKALVNKNTLFKEGRKTEVSKITPDAVKRRTEFDAYVSRGTYQKYINDLKASGLSQEAINKISLSIRSTHIAELQKNHPELGKVVIAANGSTVNVENFDVIEQLEPTTTRLMVGNHGVYVEFNTPTDKGTFIKKRLQYNEYNRDGQKLYDQFKTVNYASYKVGKWYSHISGYFKSPVTSSTPEFDKLPEHTGNTNTYAGVGSRSTPLNVQQVIVRVSEILGRTKRTLNTGDAGGADKAFTRGAEKTGSSFNAFEPQEATELTKTIAREIHEKPQALRDSDRPRTGLKLMARNTFQVFGKDLKTPVDFLLAWSPNGETRADQRVYIKRDHPKNTGGTGQAIALASLKNIPVINLNNTGWLKELGVAANLSEVEIAYIRKGGKLPPASVRKAKRTKSADTPSVPLPLIDETSSSLGDEYLRRRIHFSLLFRHEKSEEKSLQRQSRGAQEVEVNKLQNPFAKSVFNNKDLYNPVSIKKFTEMVGESELKAAKATKTTKARKERKATGAHKEVADNTKAANTEMARLKKSGVEFKFIMRTTRDHPEISMEGAREMHDRLIQEQQYLIDENAADKETLVSMVSRYKAEVERLGEASKRRLDVIKEQKETHSKFFIEHKDVFKKIAPSIKEYARTYSLIRSLDESISDRNISRGYLFGEVRKMEELNTVDLFVTEELKKISPTMLAEMEGIKDEIQSEMKTEFEELVGFSGKEEELVGFSNASNQATYTRLQNEIDELETALDEADLHPQLPLDFKIESEFADTPLANQLKAKRLQLQSFYVNLESEPKRKSLVEQTSKAQGKKAQGGQGPSAQRNVAELRTFKEGFEFGRANPEEGIAVLRADGKRRMKAIAAAVRQVTQRIKTTAEVLTLEEAMEVFNMTRQDLLKNNGLYFKGKIWVKENLNPAVMREIIAHEIGHSVFENELRTASTKIQNDIRKQFDTWRERVRGKSVHDVIQSKAAFNTAMKYITESKNRAVSSLSAVDQKYLLDFEEWFADQVAVWESAKPVTTLQKFFRKIANLIRKVMGRQSQDSVREFLDSISQRNYVASAINRGRRFFEYARASKQIPDNSLITHLLKSAPSDMADIESLSRMLPSMFTKADLSLLGRAFTQGHVRSQLFRLYPDHALKMFDESVSRTVAAGLVQWAHGQLKVGPKVHSVYEKAMGKIAKTFKGRTELQKQTEALHLIKQGKAIWGHVTDLGLTSIRTDAKDIRDIDSVSDAFVKLGDVFEKVFLSANDRLYGTKNPALIRLAEMFHSRTGSRLIKQGYFQEKQRHIGRFISSATNVLKDVSNEEKIQILTDLRTGNLTTNASKGMRKIYNAMYAYALKSGIDIKLLENYVPRIWDKEFVANNRGELEALLEQYNVVDPEESIDRILGLEDREIEEWVIPYTPALRAEKERALKHIPDTVLAEAGFISNDLDYLTVNYIESVVKRAEYVKRFGDNSETIIKITQDAESLGATVDDIELMHSYIQAMMGITGHETNAALASMLGLKAPPPEQKINPAIQQVLSTVLVIRNLALLSLATFTSLADPLGISVRSGSLSDTGVALKTGMQEIWNSITGNESDIKRLADALGILESHMTNVALQWEYGGTYMAPWARTVNDTFFKWIGLTGLTRLTRSMALGASHSFIARHASDPNENSLRYLEELNLLPEDILLATDGKSVRILTFQERANAPEHERVRDDKVRAAMNQFVDEAILRPNAAQRPIWASDPHYMLVFHLKAFMYSFHDRILRRAYTEVGQHNNLAPMVGLAMFVPALLFIDSLRDLVKHGGTPSYKQNWDVGDYTFNAMERSGLFGIYQQGFDIRQAQQFGGTGAEPLAGGVFFPVKAVTDPVGILPFANLIK